MTDKLHVRVLAEDLKQYVRDAFIPSDCVPTSTDEQMKHHFEDDWKCLNPQPCSSPENEARLVDALKQASDELCSDHLCDPPPSACNHGACENVGSCSDRAYHILQSLLTAYESATPANEPRTCKNDDGLCVNLLWKKGGCTGCGYKSATREEK